MGQSEPRRPTSLRMLGTGLAQQLELLSAVYPACVRNCQRPRFRTVHHLVTHTSLIPKSLITWLLKTRSPLALLRSDVPAVVKAAARQLAEKSAKTRVGAMAVSYAWRSAYP